MKKDFLRVADYTREQIIEILNLAIKLKKDYFSRGNEPILKDKVLAMIFNKPSLRTRISFDMAMRHLGGDALFISPNEIGLGKRESIADVARVLSGYVQAIMARVFNFSHLIELAKWSSVPVINGLSDYNHPCQAMADLLTILEHFGKLKNINITFIGDGNNVAVSLMHAAAKVGANFTIANPVDYDLPKNVIEEGISFSRISGSRLSFIHDPHKAIKNTDVIYTDTWTSMGQEEEKKKREKIFMPFQVNSKLLKEAKKSTIIMHCLPAHRGKEITSDVADSPQSLIFQQAHNRLHAQKAILAKLLTEK